MGRSIWTAASWLFWIRRSKDKIRSQRRCSTPAASSSQLEARSDHTFTLKEGTLYPILHGLENEKAVTSYEKESPSGRKRKYYHITKKGLRLLEEKKAEWQVFSEKVNAIVTGAAGAIA